MLTQGASSVKFVTSTSCSSSVSPKLKLLGPGGVTHAELLGTRNVKFHINGSLNCYRHGPVGIGPCRDTTASVVWCLWFMVIGRGDGARGEVKVRLWFE